ncbi:NADPH-dependent F420 reductase [Candidatus Pantoea bituminis]|uniref:NADPH-dependent F420 reductase n=1 Tax=Candidatus Pantoea bituminis TaxID=2831036 RepID=UPI0028120506|nr:NAD(P)-binding domain-containing protein [Pantoea bituminis]
MNKVLNMKIGIIGAGNIGATLARKLSAGGHEIKLANSRGPDSIRDLARDVGATAVTREDAVKDVDAIILAIPFEKHRGLSSLFSQVPECVVVIDTSNYYPFRDSAIAEVDNGKPESVWASEQTGRQLVKAWNAVLAATLADKGLPSGAPDRIALPVAGDDARAKAVVLKLVNETGFDALDAGPLSESWRQQPGTPAYCTELDTEELKKALSFADAARAPKNRDDLIKEFMTPGANFTHEDVIARNREVTA